MMNTTVFEQYESEVRSYCRKFPEVFVSSKGAYIQGESGKSYLDFFCGAGALNYGHNHPYVKQQASLSKPLKITFSSRADWIIRFSSPVPPAPTRWKRR